MTRKTLIRPLSQNGGAASAGAQLSRAICRAARYYGENAE